MRLLLTIITFGLSFASCKNYETDQSAVSGIEISYFTKDFYTYTNSNGWLITRGGLSGNGLHYTVCHKDKLVEIIMDYDRKTERASSLEFHYPHGDKDSELLLQDILKHIKGASDILQTVDNTNKSNA